MSAQGPQHFGTRKRVGEEGRFRQETAAQTPLPTRGTMYTKPFPGGRGLEPRKQRGRQSLPRHPFELYRTTSDEVSGWAVYPATVNGTIEPEIGGVSIFADPPPILDVGDNFSAYLNFNMDASSFELAGSYYLLSGSQELSNVNISTSPLTETPVTVDSSSGAVTPGQYSFLIASVVGGVKNSQPMRFSVNYSICSGGGLQISAYG